MPSRFFWIFRFSFLDARDFLLDSASRSGVRLHGFELAQPRQAALDRS